MGKPVRLYFIDALRAFAILMMLQGHFISGLLDPVFKNPDNPIYSFWLYCRGFTAPVFFTITGWVFTFLLLRSKVQGWKNPRIKKGLKRILELLAWGYLLRLNLPMLFNGEINHSFLYPDVLQIIGLSLSFIILIYLMFGFLERWTGLVFLGIGILIFISQPLYVDTTFPELPNYLAAYLTKANKGVFYLFPWLGYVYLGTFIAYLFNPKTEQLWAWGFGFLALGYWLINRSSAFLIDLEFFTGIELFRKVAYNNFLFIRLGDVFLLFGIFILLNDYLKKGLWTRIGSKTLEIYIVHYFIFYGSLFGIGLYKYFKYSWTFPESIIGAYIFMLLCTGIVLLDDRYREKLFTFYRMQSYQMRKAIIFFIVLYSGYFIAKRIQKNWAEAPAKTVVTLLDTLPSPLPLDKSDFNVLLYSKANGWVHKDAIAAAKEVFPRLAQQQGWKLTVSDDSTLFNPAQLSYFDVVIWNNVTGQTLDDRQRKAFKSYIETGGGFVGIHGSGDDSHQWDWYDKKVIRTLFSHHPMQPQFQVATLNKMCNSLFPATKDFPDQWQWEDEWYVFYESPKQYGSTVLYNLDESNLVMVGEREDKQWSMGEDHPVVWYHCQKKGKVFYTAMGHKGTYYQDALYQQLLIEAVQWAGNTSINCN